MVKFRFARAKGENTCHILLWQKPNLLMAIHSEIIVPNFVPLYTEAAALDPT